MAMKDDKRRSVKLTADNTLAVLIVQSESEWTRCMTFNQVANSLLRHGVKTRKTVHTIKIA
jgi:hypothetical protein